MKLTGVVNPHAVRHNAHMAKKQNKPRTADRHRPRRMVSLSPELHEQLALLADRNGRPLNWEVRLALEAHLKANGLWPPPVCD